MAIVSLTFFLGSQSQADPLDVGRIVGSAGLDVRSSTIVIERQSDGQLWISNPARAGQRFSPASTSKIPHTLIALESGVADVSTVFEWDGVSRRPRLWNRDQTLHTAFQHSAVWVFQEIALTAGQAVMSQGLVTFEYGNMNTGSIDQLSTYWLDDTLMISALEQVEFLSRLALKELPLSDATYSAAWDIMVSERSDNWILRSKTGWRYSKTEIDIGWFVGWLECPGDVYVFALNLDMPDTHFLSRRRYTTYAALEQIGALDC